MLLKTTNLGGATKPYIELNVFGNCVGSSINFDFFRGSSSSCSWTLDGTEFNTGCNDFWYTFNDIGSYDISVTTENNAGEQSTLSTTIHIVNPPKLFFLMYNLMKPLLSKEAILKILKIYSIPNCSINYSFKMPLCFILTWNPFIRYI